MSTMYDQESANYVRGIVQRGVVTSTNDNGGIQTADVTVMRDHRRSGVEVYQPWGLASNAPGGGVTLLLAVGGDQGDMVALPVGNPANRMGKLKSGEVALYSSDGSRVLIKPDGTIDVVATKGCKVRVKDQAVVEVTEDMIRAKLASGSRFVVKASFAKMVGGGAFVAATGGQVIVSSTPVVGAEPEPGV